MIPGAECPTHGRVSTVEAEWGPSVDGLPGTWLWFRGDCGCVIYPNGEAS